ncbi:protein FAM13B-like isoform X2 [Limulus polyphemus]|uniref:Protein FAM13B-like isoform X2 n=1 Tax=Limulus polyphemus TaxID=6850 RepID=A0ABM1SYZ3_LIMPO|nr:protein FAM13B-like isoform X2 [Limulus polyphemus]
MRKPLGSACRQSYSTVILRQDLESDKREKLDDVPDLTVSSFTTDISAIRQKTFGIPLTKLVEKTLVECSIPFVLIRICYFIEEKGLDDVDLHPTLGNAQLVECLRTSFDETGDAPLETKCDVVSATMLLKMFFRELPDPVVPKGLFAACIRAVQDIKRDKEGCVLKLKYVVEELPFENFNTLKFISSFIVRANQQHNENKLSALMCFVLGPEIFRLADEEDTCKNQLITNQLIGLFISDYSTIFGGDAELAFREKEDPLRRKIDSLNVRLHSNNLVKPMMSLDPSTISPTVSLKPLSITIPPVEDYITEDVSLDSQVPTLLVNSQVETPSQPKMENLIYPHPGRKRKERRPSGEKPQSEMKGKVLEHDEIKTWCLDHGTSYEEPETISQYTTCEKKKQSDLIIMHWWDRIHQETTAELSPHPPQAKRREVDSSGVEPVLDLGGNSGSSFVLLDKHDFHEVQRSAERLAPVGKLLLVPKKKSRFKLPGTARNDQRKNLVHPSEQVSEDYVSENKESHSGHSIFNTSKNAVKASKHIVDNGKENFEKSWEIKHETAYTSNPKCGSSIWHDNFHSCGHKEKRPSQGSGSQISHPLLERHPVINTNLSCSSDEVFSEEHNVPSFDFTFSDDHENQQEPVLSEHRHNWPVGNGCSEDPMLSSSLYNSGEVRLFEAPLSPSAGNCLPYLESLDPNLPPSPPKDQYEFSNRSFKNEDKMSSTVKQLRKKIHGMKKKIRKFDEAFELEHGFKPSHADKMKYSEVKKVMTELNRVRKELKGLREEQQLEQYSHDSTPLFFTGGIRNSDVLDVDNYKYLKEDFFKETMTELYEKNFVHGSQVVTKDKVLEKKLTSQKNGLKFESTVDQMFKKAGENALHPTQDHYFNTKRSVGRTNFFAKEQGMELQPILEHVAMDFVSMKKTTDPTMEENLLCLNEALKPKDQSCSYDHKGLEVKKSAKDYANSRFNNSKLHKLSLPELIIQQRQTRAEKRRLRRELREIEEGLQQKNERKMPQEHRISVEPVYSEYKHAKGKLKLLEALVTKHELHRRI